ncbi:DNA integrity scanning diadenylate cyclase DisA [Raineyella sp. W15-4]|uniref:DNA integrity scanning diadenylate cyclase DisA n=1 Tax=Raineyella sp. W15-4 TaxID=3081651 RepID=UPI00295415A4|nr:DNA integrity scanning diadenylate cyclase DisA [Raineyella sp. W15-4]WOQ16289.1 DNA integrity scanning diadenylate cyclase DisA [Raineyella sp. W15-4]
MTAEDQQGRTRRFRALTAPGTPLRNGLDRIVKGRTGGLVVLGLNREVEGLMTGGFHLDAPVTPQNLRELAKLDGAIVLSADLSRIVAAGVQLMPDPGYDTVETGTRHRTADRVSRQTGVPTVSVSASMQVISLFIDGERLSIPDPGAILGRADQGLRTLERYTNRLAEVTDHLSALEIRDQVTVRDVAVVLQRLEMVHRIQDELRDYVIELGTEGRLIDLQIRELESGLDNIAELLIEDYRDEPNGVAFDLTDLSGLSTTDLVDLTTIERAVGFGTTDLEAQLYPRGYRQLSRISSLPRAVAARLLDHFGSLQEIFAASLGDLQAVDGVGLRRARAIRDALAWMAESEFDELA